MSAEDPFETVLVAYGPEQLQDIAVHDQEDGSSVIETVTYRPIRVFEKRPDGSLKELFDEAKDRALEAFWADCAAFNELNDINGGNHR
ncbi:hypothetical protein [Streptomyces sp. NPDC046979]|uniref:hypothetical protein n=1 Tax=Streptomyces sp. NPDC046979 TaxID=3154604 RepID=UPI0033D6CBD9